MNIFNRIRGQRGDADPLLTIGAMVATLIVSAAIVGSVVALINIGSKYTADQVNATNISSARDAFAADAQNANTVSAASDSAVTFTQNPSGSAVTTDRGTTGKTCRVSNWASVKEADGSYTLVNTVTKTAWNAGTKSCAVAAAKDGTKALSVTGFSAAPTIGYSNAAGTAITFNATGTGTTPARPASSYYTAEEWGSKVPKTIVLTGQATSRASGTKPSTLTGVTNLQEVHSALAPVGNEPPPAQGTYDPAKPAIISVVRSGTVGAVYAGAREGIRVTWGAAYCGPYSVKYDVKYTASTPGVAPKSFSVTGYAAQYNTDFAQVPNGSVGTVSVTATCPTEVSKKPATTTAGYNQPLPAPGLTNQILSRDTHRLNWTGGLSSLPVSYLPFAKHSTQGSYGQAWWVSGNSFDWGWPAGYTYGVSNYIVRASVSGGLTADSNRSDATVAWPGIPATGVWNYDSGGAIYNNTIGWNSIGCPAGTSPQYNPVVSGRGQGWRTSLSLRIGVNYATTYSAYVQTHCVSPFETSGAANSGTTSWRTNNPPPPVPNAPSVGGTYTRGVTGGGGSSVTIGSSAYATSYEFGTRIFTAQFNSGWSSTTASGPGTYTGASLCGAVGTVTSGGARAKAGGQSGWSGYRTSSLNLVGGRYSCN